MRRDRGFSPAVPREAALRTHRLIKLGPDEDISFLKGAVALPAEPKAARLEKRRRQRIRRMAVFAWEAASQWADDNVHWTRSRRPDFRTFLEGVSADDINRLYAERWLA